MEDAGDEPEAQDRTEQAHLDDQVADALGDERPVDLPLPAEMCLKMSIKPRRVRIADVAAATIKMIFSIRESMAPPGGGWMSPVLYQ